MRREEAEQEAAWRNAHDERRARLEFYAFDASVGLAEDAWEVTMRLRSEPTPMPVADPPAAAPLQPAATPEVAPDVAAPDDLPPQPAAAAQPPSDLEPWEHPTAEPAIAGEAAPEAAPAGPPPEPARRWLRAGRRMRAAPRPRIPPPRRPRRERPPDEPRAADLALEPPRTLLERLTRLVGNAVIAVAILWVGMVTALALLTSTTSTLGLLIYGVALLVGLAAIGLGLAIRRT
ncbi:MAG: hypothetical protein ACJ76S_13355 [Solirubrobacteraceae bacterium]